jgi:hypothetical protein
MLLGQSDIDTGSLAEQVKGVDNRHFGGRGLHGGVRQFEQRIERDVALAPEHTHSDQRGADGEGCPPAGLDILGQDPRRDAKQ